MPKPKSKDSLTRRADEVRAWSRNKELYEKALSAIKNLYSDTSVSHEQARENLQGLRDEIDIMYDTLKD